MKIPITREIFLRRYGGGGRCVLCDEYLRDGETANINIEHIARVLFKSIDVCHNCVAVIGEVWIKVKGKPDKAEDIQLRHKKTVYAETENEDEDENEDK